MGWLIALAVVALLAVAPLGVRARYDADGAAAHLYLGPFRVPLYPSHKVSKKTKKVRIHAPKARPRAIPPPASICAPLNHQIRLR